MALIAAPITIYAINYDPPGVVDPTNGIQNIMNGIISFLWQFFVGLAVIMFIIAGILFLTSNGAPDKITQARNAFIWGVVGVIVAIVAFSIVAIISGAVT